MTLGGVAEAGDAEVLLERDAEIANLGRLLDRAVVGSGGGLLVRGPAGIGKSALLRSARAAALSRHVRVLEARGAPFERQYPFGVVRQLLDPVLADVTLKSSVLTGAAAAVASVFDPDGAAPSPPDASFAVTYGLYLAVLNLAALGPVLLSIDDLHWVDEPSLRIVDFVLRRIGAAPIAVVAGLRSGEQMNTDQVGVIEELEATGALGVVEPKPLSGTAAMTVGQRMFGADIDEEFAEVCHVRTSGNPLFLTELMRALADDGVAPTAQSVPVVNRSAPKGLNRVILARLARLGEDAVALSRAAAMLGDRGRLVDATALAELSPDRAHAAAELLMSAGLLVVEPGALLRFEHPVMRDAIEADVAPHILAGLHAAAADVLARHGRDAELVAAHTLLSVPAANTLAVDRLRVAARLAMARSAPDEAVHLLTRALEEPPQPDDRPGLLAELGAAEAAARLPISAVHLGEAVATTPPGAERAMSALLLARLLTFAGQSSAVYSTVASGQEGLGPEHQDLFMALEGVALTAGGIHPEGRALSPGDVERLAALAGATPGERSVLACVAFSMARAAEPTQRVLEITERAISRRGCRIEPGSDPFTALMLIIVLQWCGQLDRAITLSTGMLEDARSINSAMLHTETLASRASARWWAGDLDEAEADVRLSFETEGMVTGAPSPVAMSVLVRTLTDRGDLAHAHSVGTEYALAANREDLMVQEFIATALGRTEVAMGRYADALARLSAAGDIAARAGVSNAAVSEWRLHAAEALVGLGRHDEARDMLAPALECARRSGGAAELGGSLRVAAMIERPVSLPILEEALAVLAPSELRLDVARVSIELGAALRRSNSRRDARERLEQGLDIAQRCGAERLVKRAMTELGSAGARPRRTARSGVDALTPSERRVVGLAAQGLSNGEIAQQLFVSTRTVETHLANAFSKLQISSRQGLSGLLEAPAE